MTDEKQNTEILPEFAEPVIQTHRSFSLVWLVPLVALVIGGWLAIKAISEKGPTITITFKTADGLEAGKTKIKFKDVEIGQVDAIRLSKDASHVVVTADMDKQAADFLTESTQFWVVRARVTGGEVSGLGTLFSGAYIAVDPGKNGKSTHHFKGLEIPPVMTTDLPGRHFRLKATRLGSINYGSPVYYRQIKVGEVDGFSLDEGGETVDIQIFIQAPYHKFVYTNSRFWQSSGLDFELSAQGLRVDTESVMSLVIGGIAFGTFDGGSPGEPAEENAQFRLYDNYSSAQKIRYEKTGRCLLYFDESIRGLAIGAPVEFRGIEIGEVVDIRLETGSSFEAIKISVAIEFDAERCGMSGRSEEERLKSLEALVREGLRAQLKVSNLLTGQLFVALDFHPDVASQKVDFSGEYPSIPTVPGDLEGIMTNVSRFIARLDKLPVEGMGKNLDQLIRGMDKLVNSPELIRSVQALGAALQELKVATGTFNESTLPSINNTLAKMEKALGEIETILNSEAPLQYDLRRALEELTAAARAVKSMADLIERHPESLIRGKGGAD
jgi:paraquat-inducible protein B